MKRVLTFFLAVAMLLITAVPFAQAAPSFSDVSRTHWAYKDHQRIRGWQVSPKPLHYPRRVRQNHDCRLRNRH